ncbi:hypothetical protein [Chryseobacterium cucumeris]|uniref:hypothetical protein n=1 Tax=Chryseobacterium cucumeris TaxID=1813611 RepID=UPI0037C11567
MSKLTFNDHLDDMMDRLMNEDLKGDELDLEIKRSKAICQIAAAKIEDKKTGLEFIRLMSQGEINPNMIPGSFIEEYKQIGHENRT